MENKEKLELLEDVMDLELGSLVEDVCLSDIDEWDSVSVLSFIAMVDEEFDKVITGKEVKSCMTVADLMAIME